MATSSPPAWLRSALRLTGPPLQWGFAMGLLTGAALIPGPSPLRSAAALCLFALLVEGVRCVVAPAKLSPWLPVAGCAVAIATLQATGRAPLLFQGSSGLVAVLILVRELVVRRLGGS